MSRADRAFGEDPLRGGDFPFETPVQYERSATRHWIGIDGLSVPDAAAVLEVVALSRVCEEGGGKTLCSGPVRFELP